MSRVALFLGSAGAGKSTLINKLLGKEVSSVSHLKLVDGTARIQGFPDFEDIALQLIDTPGIDSVNFPCCVTEQIQNLFPEQDVLVVLVMNAKSRRVTSYMDKIEETI